MNKTKRLVLVIIALVTLAASTDPAFAFVRCRNMCAQPETGYLYCRSKCVYPAICQGDTELRCDQYCYYDFVVGVCHEGSDDCCVQQSGGF